MPEFIPTDEQERLLGHQPNRHARVLAGPGTGKSATLVALIEQLSALERQPRIRLLTFTRAATGELAKKVSEHPAVAAQRPSTIHSFAISVLIRNPGTGNLPEPLRIADEWEYSNIVRPTLARRVGIGVKRLDQLVREMAANWESLQEANDPRVNAEERARFHAAWGEHRRVYGYTLLQELPFALRRALLDHDDLVGLDYDLLIVDEYQDLNACDLEVLHLIADSGTAIIGAGDDDQSIYSFRKAAPEGIRRFLNDYAGAEDYSLSVAQRSGSRIIDWSTFVIAGDPDRPARPTLRPADGAPEGEVALLSFRDQAAEARGIANLVDSLMDHGVEPSDILVLLRGDFNATFSGPIKAEFERLGVPYSDPDAVDRMLDEPQTRRLLAHLRILHHESDSLAWATLARLEPGIGDAFVDHLYGEARVRNNTLGELVLAERETAYDGAPRAPATRFSALVESVLAWRSVNADRAPLEGSWGQRILEMTHGTDLSPTEAFAELLTALDDLVEGDAGLGRYLSQIAPLGKDRERNQSRGVRIMTMASAKGLTVRATIIAACEDGVIPRPDADRAEERRLLYVAMTRSRDHLYITWARRRTGPTARAGMPRVYERRTYSDLLTGGPVDSEDGNAYRIPDP